MSDETLVNDVPQVVASSGGFLKGLLIGAVAGAALGVLFAPKSGVHLRRDLSRSATRLRKDAMKKYARASDTVSGLVERGQEVLDRGRKSFQEARAAAMHTAERS